MQHYKHDAHTALILLTVFVLLCICEEKRCRLQHVLGRDERAPPRAVAEKSDNVKFVMACNIIFMQHRIHDTFACLRFASNETSTFVLTFVVLAIPSNGA
jgi:hypothetical protein